MNQEFFTNLPSEIIINILSRLPIRNIIISKCVCKPWLNLLETPEFAKSHLSKSVPGLVVYREMATGIFNILEFEESLELENHELHYNPVVELDRRAFSSLPYGCIGIQGSANGLLLLREFNTQPNALYVCNPITREYIELPSPKWMACSYPTIVTYGFGVSKMSGEYKVVRIYHECIRDPSTHALMSIPKSEYQIYTLGTGSWRRIILGDCFEYNCRSSGVFLNGNLHWLVADLKDSSLISCLNLETELFSSFCTPTLPERSRFLGGIVVLGDCLCLCDNTSENEIVIWVMKEYGVETSWTKEFVISKIPDFAGESHEVVSPLKVFRDGDILMWWEDFSLFYYCNKSKTARKLDMFEQETCWRLDAMLHTSSFVSLKSFVIENVNSF
ncbi:hypothetical protein BUALT_Bualt08G0130500 [Buddleja alternifolia]|uniref:F-box domain-containing protein n=1 Tax=Buddleja alternifolia TaxID=168488 RepID=A0AAV6X5E6_9LAMI|nr:hypothetical protein BUALT_Bualt08G0130500 [Buddleja alternifolia]